MENIYKIVWDVCVKF